MAKTQRPKMQRMDSLSKRINQLYDQLSRCQEVLESLAFDNQPSDRRVAVAILSEDVNTLLEECEDKLFDWSHASSGDIESFENRALTVLEEVEQFLHIVQIPPAARAEGVVYRTL